jgi:hypothetical protein
MRDRPLQRLHASHRRPDHGVQRTNPNRIEHRSLTCHHVTDRESRESGARLSHRVGRRRRQSVAEGIDRYDDKSIRIERATGTDPCVEPVVMRGNSRKRKHSGYVIGRHPGGTLRSVDNVADVTIAQCVARLHRQVAQHDMVMRSVDPARLVGGMLTSAQAGHDT